MPSTRSRNSLPVLKKGTCFSFTDTASPVRGLRPWRGGRLRTEKAPKAPQFHALSAFKSLRDFFKYRIDDPLHVTLEKVRIGGRQFFDQFRLDHGFASPG